MRLPSFKAILYATSLLWLSTGCFNKSYQEAMNQLDYEGIDFDKGGYGGLLVVKKDQVGQNGLPTGETEYYVRASSQDYLIKFCESSYSRRQFEAMLSCDNTIEDVMHLCSWKGSYQVKQGALDHCKSADALSASRIGYYAVLTRD